MKKLFLANIFQSFWGSVLPAFEQLEVITFFKQLFQMRSSEFEIVDDDNGGHLHNDKNPLKYFIPNQVSVFGILMNDNDQYS
jgi:hypothetical protein